jgi:ERCC4-type nuclease
LKPFQPIIQIEIEPVNRKTISDFLSSLSYSAFYLKDELLFPVGENLLEIEGDLFFIPQLKMKLAEPYLGK